MHPSERITADGTKRFTQDDNLSEHIWGAKFCFYNMTIFTSFDEDMTILDTIKDIAYMHNCQVISSANYSIIYLCHPEQKYFTHFCLSNRRCMGHLYNPHMKIRENEKFRLCSKSPLTSLLGQEKIRVQVSHVLIQIRTTQTYLTQNANIFSYGLRIG